MVVRQSRWSDLKNSKWGTRLEMKLTCSLRCGRAAFLALTVLPFFGPISFGAMRDCKGVVEITLDGPVKMKFCEIPAASDVLIGDESGESDEVPVIARNFHNFQ